MGLGGRSRALKDAIAAAESEADATIGLPSRVEPGSFGFTYMVDAWDSGELQAEDIEFEWDGARWVTWTSDISQYESISPGSSAPIHGIASWLNGRDLFVAYSGPDIETEGWARVPAGAPSMPEAGTIEETADDSELLANPKRWVQLARTITAITHEQVSLPGMTGERYTVE